jgi:hypothetical protein
LHPEPRALAFGMQLIEHRLRAIEERLGIPHDFGIVIDE